MAPLEWFKSSYSTQGGQCVEVSASLPDAIPVRDSKDPEGPTLTFPTAAWSSFLTAIRSGEFGDA